MSILIKGLEMPKNCLECVFYRRTDPVYDYCCISSTTPKEYVPNDCPLVEIPPHGRLIDADAMERNLVKMQMAQKGVVGHGIRKSRAVVRDMATVIPADEDGET